MARKPAARTSFASCKSAKRRLETKHNQRGTTWTTRGMHIYQLLGF